ncbi:MAG: hypothetical protein K2P99_01595, partial [Burkholderiales bacterium]|nr:hypothetical protein [Burkholderiales bacterium]
MFKLITTIIIIFGISTIFATSVDIIKFRNAKTTRIYNPNSKNNLIYESCMKLIDTSTMDPFSIMAFGIGCVDFRIKDTKPLNKQDFYVFIYNIMLGHIKKTKPRNVLKSNYHQMAKYLAS